MNKVDTTALLERVERLERQNKWIRIAGFVAVLSVALMLLCGAKTSKKIEAEAFVVEDAQGRTRAVLGVHVDGFPALSLYDEQGTRRAALSLEKGPALKLYDEKGVPLALLVSSPLGTALQLADEKGTLRVSLAALEKGPELDLRDEKGTRRFSLFAFEKGPVLALYDEKGTHRASLVAVREGPALSLYDEKGQLEFIAP